LTDSGGFQVFSLGLSKTPPPFLKGGRGDFVSISTEPSIAVPPYQARNTAGVAEGGGAKHQVNIKLTEDGVKFSSPYDGSKHFFTPENVVDTQIAFGSDIMMVLDVCSP
jgi:tRNA-guanine family transglycosylase